MVTGLNEISPGSGVRPLGLWILGCLKLSGLQWRYKLYTPEAITVKGWLARKAQKKAFDFAS